MYEKPGFIRYYENNKVAVIKRVRDGQEYYVFSGGGIENGEGEEF